MKACSHNKSPLIYPYICTLPWKHEFKLLRFIYTQILLRINIVLQDLKLVESKDMEMRVWRADCKLYGDF